MEARWEQVPGGKVKMVLFLVLIVFVALLIVVGSSIVKVDGDEVGIVEKKLFGGDLPTGKIISIKGDNGIQAQVLVPGWHVKWKWQYDVNTKKLTEIKEGYVGLVYALDGRSLEEGMIYAPRWSEPDKMKQAEYFLDAAKGNGYKGPQLTVLKPGKHRLNLELFKVTQVSVTNVPVGTVAVIKSNVGEIVETEDGLVAEGQRGIWRTPLSPMEYYLNTNAYEVTMISTRQVKVSYSAEKERGEKAATQPMRPITVRSKDAYTFPIVVRVTYFIEAKNAPRVVATIGDDDLVLTKLVTPAVENIFRNNAGKVKALEYVQAREEQEEKSASMLRKELSEYGITVLAVRIGDVGDEKSLGLASLLKTQMDREIALQEQETFQVQQMAAEQQKALKKTQQEAEEEKNLAIAAYRVKIAEQQKLQLIIEAHAEAERIKLVADAQAKAYKLIAAAIGTDNAALIEIMKLVAEKKINITPDIMVSGSGGGMTDALMGTILRGKLKGKDR